MELGNKEIDMGKFYDDTVLDGSPNILKNAATTAVFCSAEPANYAGIAAVSLITKTGLTPASFTNADGDISGRKLMLNAITGMVPSANGTVSWLALHNGVTLLAKTQVTAQAVTTAQIWDSTALRVMEVKDPV